MGRVRVIREGQTSAGEGVTFWKMENEAGASVVISSYGGAIVSIEVPDRNGCMTDVVLGYDSVAGYQEYTTYFGALIGRCGNRIAKGQVEIAGESYQLAVNNGPNHLHGGMRGFDKRIWQGREAENALILSLTSEHLEEQYPGKLNVQVTYTFDEENCLTIDYQAKADRDTLCNLTNHVYFNLAGHNSGAVTNQLVQICGDAYLPVDENLIPTGALRPVEGTPFDFRTPKAIGRDINIEDTQLILGGGYDHNFVLTKKAGEKMGTAARAYSEESGISLVCKTTQPGMQFYTGNHIQPQCSHVKASAAYDKRHGFCFETQNFPDAIHHENFPNAVLKSGEVYHHVTSYQFGVGPVF